MTNDSTEIANDTFRAFIGNNATSRNPTIGLMIKELRVWGI